MAVTVPDNPPQLVVITGEGNAATVTDIASDEGDLLPEVEIVRTDML